MAESSSVSASNDEQELKDIRDILWGPNIRLDVFRRWSQGLCCCCCYCVLVHTDYSKMEFFLIKSRVLFSFVVCERDVAICYQPSYSIE